MRDTRQNPATLSTGPAVQACRCGHGRDVHEHYRAGSDCARCGRTGCPGYRGRSGPSAVLRALLQRLGEGQERPRA